MNEQAIQKTIIKYLESIGCYVVKVISASRTGIPDLIFMHEGRFCAIEVKAVGKENNTSKLQDWNLNRINELGGTAIISDNLKKVKETFK